LLNDYEGISGQERYRADLVLMYFVTFDANTKQLLGFSMTPLQTRRLRLNRVAPTDAQWLQRVLDRESRKRGARVELADDQRFELRW
jgi:poly-gamma-glutamate capsule biosynthesis protein CapA/YwtB (metallophosphatase superfamily)